MKYFQQAILEKKNLIKVRNFPFTKIGKKKILVKIFYSGVCKSQLMEASGFRGRDKWLPHGFGHEASGIVVDSNQSKKFKKNDKVICSWIRRENKKISGFVLQDKLGVKINFGDIATFGNYAVISENCIYKKPKDLEMKKAALFGCAIPTGMGMVFNQLKLKRKDKVLLVGLGGVGLSSMLALKIKKFQDQVFILENNRLKIKIARKEGFFNFINTKDILKNKKYKNFFDKCVETSGNNKLIEIAFDAIKNNGYLLFSSHPENKKYIKLNPHDLIKGKKILGSWGGNCKLDRDIPKFNFLIKKNKINLNIFFKKNYKLCDISKALDDLKNNNAIRPIIKI